MQPQRALLVAAAHRVHQRRAECRQRPGLERAVARRGGLRAGPAQDLDPRQDGAGLDRRLPRLQLRRGRLGVAHRGARGRARLARREPQLGSRRGAQLPLEQRLALGDLSLGVAAPAGPREAADQQLLRWLVERFAGHQVGGQGGRPLDVAGGQRRHGAVVGQTRAPRRRGSGG